LMVSPEDKVSAQGHPVAVAESAVLVAKAK
jgi:hypothetical protein